VAGVALCVVRRRHIGWYLVLRQLGTSRVIITVYRILHDTSKSEPVAVAPVAVEPVAYHTRLLSHTSKP
jgi:hypothetical protein